LGFSFSFNSPSALLTSLTLRQAIWRKADERWIVFGIPEVLYTDNGSDFTSIHLEQVAADIKLRLIFSPGHPRGRGRIERFFETVNQMFLSDLPGYTGEGGQNAQLRGHWACNPALNHARALTEPEGLTASSLWTNAVDDGVEHGPLPRERVSRDTVTGENRCLADAEASHYDYVRRERLVVVLGPAGADGVHLAPAHRKSDSNATRIEPLVCNALIAFHRNRPATSQRREIGVQRVVGRDSYEDDPPVAAMGW
jgi:hypothetical protein